MDHNESNGVNEIAVTRLEKDYASKMTVKCRKQSSLVGYNLTYIRYRMFKRLASIKYCFVTCKSLILFTLTNIACFGVDRHCNSTTSLFMEDSYEYCFIKGALDQLKNNFVSTRMMTLAALNQIDRCRPE